MRMTKWRSLAGCRTWTTTRDRSHSVLLLNLAHHKSSHTLQSYLIKAVGLIRSHLLKRVIAADLSNERAATRPVSSGRTFSVELTPLVI